MRKLLIYLCLIVSVSAHAVIAKPGSGVYGDEYYHYRLGSNNEIKSAGSTVPRQIPNIGRAPQITSSFPTKGEVHSLVILVNFADLAFITPDANTAFHKMLNEKGYSANRGTGSARDYFLANSQDQFQPYFDVYGPVQLSKPYAEYDGHVAEMIVEACDSLEHVIDWDRYDANDDGDVDNIFIYYAGHNKAEGGPEHSIWPHRSYVYTRSGESWIRYYYRGKSGKNRWLWDYACTSELTGPSGKNMCGIGTFCHEFSHVLGLDDLYNTSNSEIYTVGEWDIMASGNYNNNGKTPPCFSAFERFMLGWLTPVQLTGTEDCLLEPIETSNKAYLIANEPHNMSPLAPQPAEYWLLENRQRVGWDAPEGCLVGTGMLISHVTFDLSKWDNNTPNNSTPLGYTLCEAMGKASYSSAGDLYPGTGKVTSFTPKANDGTVYEKHMIQQIRLTPQQNVVFHHGPNDGSGLTMTSDIADTLHTNVLNSQIVGQEVATIEITGAKLNDSLLVITISNRSFEYSLDGIKWKTTSTTDSIDADSTYHRIIYLRYAGKRTCTSQNCMISVTQKNEIHSAQLILMGYAERPMLIQEVVAQEGKDITPYSFTANWEEQTDAEEYQLTLFTLKNTPTTQNMTIQRKLDKDGASYQLHTFPQKASKLEFSYMQPYASGDPLGYLLVEGAENDEWEVLDSILIRGISNTINKKYTWKEDEVKYRHFRMTFHTLKGNNLYCTLYKATLVTPTTINYLYKEDECPVEAGNSELMIPCLNPQTDYYYYLICREAKGCQPHETTPGNIVKVRTLPGTTKTNQQFTILSRQDGIWAYLPIVANEGSYLMVYATDGQLVQQIVMPAGETECEIPTEGLIKGHVYAVKYMTGKDLKRKQLWSKFIY